MTTTDPRIVSSLASLRNRSDHQDKVIDELRQIIGNAQDSPKYIDQLPGRRVPYFAPVELALTANSTSRVEGQHTVSTDGPFVCTAIGAFYKKTSGAYQGIWGPVTGFDARIAQSSQQHGLGGLLDQPHAISGDIEVVDQGSDRNWQHKPVASGLWAPQAGGVYVLPIANLFGRNSTIKLSFTPGLEVPHTGTLQIVLCGYKVVQGQSYQP